MLDGKLEITKELKVCKIPGEKDKYCLANDVCPKKEVDKKDFFVAHDILWYINKDEPRGDAPKKAEDDPQFKNWEKAVENWAEKQKDKDYETDPAPDKECSEDDFESFRPSVKIISPSGGATITAPSFNIKASASAGYGIKSFSVEVDGLRVFSTGDSQIDYSYTVPADKKTAALEIQAIVVDDNDNTDSSSVSITTNIVP